MFGAGPATAYVFWVTDAGVPRSIFFDVVETEAHTQTSDVTEHPVEDSTGNISDHVRHNLDEVRLEVFVSGSPINDSSLTWQDERSGAAFAPVGLDYPPTEGSRPPILTPGFVFGGIEGSVRNLLGLVRERPDHAQVLSFPEGAPSPEFVYDALTGIKEKSLLVEVVTPLRIYEDMILISVETPRTAREGDSIRMHLGFKKMRRVRSKLVSAPAVSVKRVTKPQERGKQDPHAVDAPKASVLKSALDALFGPGSPSRAEYLLRGY